MEYMIITYSPFLLRVQQKNNVKTKETDKNQLQTIPKYAENFTQI
jgi:hypothetical protein